MRTLGRRTRIIFTGAIAICLVTIIAAFIVMVFIASDLTHRVDRQQQALASSSLATCHIQARALPANKALAQTLLDINELLGRSHATTAKAAKLPPAEFALLVNLRTESGKYAAIEATQPGSRKCASP